MTKFGNGSSQAAPKPSNEPAALSTLSICRNKHWRFISSYHGPWLQLPCEDLDDYASLSFDPPQSPVLEAGVFFDIARIRRLVDEAADLSIRAANGANTSSASGRRARRGGEATKLSLEMKFRLRKLAVQKLSEAYHLDEIAASVAVMQSASALEEVAKIALDRDPEDLHAKYVHFFHEKIPSRALAESTSLDLLDSILNDRPAYPAVSRTRALVKIFKQDYTGAAKDLTDALNSLPPQHKNSDVKRMNSSPRLKDEDKPTGIELQLYFQRAQVYLSLACQHAEKASKMNWKAESAKLNTLDQLEVGTCSSEYLMVHRNLRTKAKRALKDFTAYLSKLDYYLASKDTVIPSDLNSRQQISHLVGDKETEKGVSNVPLVSDAAANIKSVTNPKGEVSRRYKLSDLFSNTPPRHLPPFPPNSLTNKSQTSQLHRMSDPGAVEMATYHPLLDEALHGLLLCHALLQTDHDEMRRHVFMVARIITRSDPMGIFNTSKTASRADWVEIINQTKDWLCINMPWDRLCCSGGMTNRDFGTSEALHGAADSINGPSMHSSEKKASRIDMKAYSLGTDRADVIARWVKVAPIIPDAPRLPKKKKPAKMSPKTLDAQLSRVIGAFAIENSI